MHILLDTIIFFQFSVSEDDNVINYFRFMANAWLEEYVSPRQLQNDTFGHGVMQNLHSWSEFLDQHYLTLEHSRRSHLDR